VKWLPWLVAGLWLVSTAAANAFVAAVNSSGNTLRWNLLTPQSGVSTNVVNTSTHAIRYFLASDGFSTTNTAAELNALRAAFAQWQAVSDTYIKFEDAGLIAPQTTINTSDNTNVIFWAKNSTMVGGGNDISGALGVTFKTFTVPGNVIVQGDIVLNGVLYSWFTDFFDNNNETSTFVEGVALHEIGHLLGLLHSPMGAATMLWVGGEGVSIQTGLSSDELAAGRYLYPTAAGSYGSINGNITKNGSPVFGAAIFVRDAASNTVAGTVSDAAGNYLVSSLTDGKLSGPRRSARQRVRPGLSCSGSGHFDQLGVQLFQRGYRVSSHSQPVRHRYRQHHHYGRLCSYRRNASLLYHLDP